jgi:hypothetical protein
MSKSNQIITIINKTHVDQNSSMDLFLDLNIF